MCALSSPPFLFTFLFHDIVTFVVRYCYIRYTGGTANRIHAQLISSAQLRSASPLDSKGYIPHNTSGLIHALLQRLVRCARVRFRIGSPRDEVGNIGKVNLVALDLWEPHI